MIDYNKFNDELDGSLDILESVGSLKEIGFTLEQAKFINLLISRAIEQHDKLLSSTE